MDATINFKLPAEAKNDLQELAKSKNTSINKMIGNWVLDILSAEKKALEAEKEIENLVLERRQDIRNGSSPTYSIDEADKMLRERFLSRIKR